MCSHKLNEFCQPSGISVISQCAALAGGGDSFTLLIVAEVVLDHLQALLATLISNNLLTRFKDFSEIDLLIGEQHRADASRLIQSHVVRILRCDADVVIDGNPGVS